MASPHTEEVTASIQLPVYNRQGVQVGSVDVDPKDFGGKISIRLMHEVVVMYEANQRSGTHSTLRRGEVAGSTKKIFRQKGTGNARAGTKRTNKRRGGGTAKGPKPRDYEYHLPKKAVKASTRMAILSKLHNQQTVILDDLALTQIKTKEVATTLKALAKTLNLKKATWLIGTEKLDPIIYKSARNIEGVKVLPTAEFNTHVVLKQKRLILTKSALEALRHPKKEEAPAPTQA